MLIQSNLDKKEEDIRIDNMQKLLAAPGSAEIVSFGMDLSPKNKWAQDQDKLGFRITKDKFKAEYGTSFHKDEITKEAKKYNLAFVPVKNYKGEYSIDFLERVQQFLKEKNMNQDGKYLQDEIYVLGPQQHRKEKLMLKEDLKDPLFFIKLPQDSNFYTLIGGNKNYVNLYNWFMGIRNKNVALYLLTSVLGVIFVILGGWYVLNTIGMTSFWWKIGLILSTIVLVVLDIVKKETDSTNDEKYS